MHHNTAGSFLTQQPEVCSRGTCNLGLIPQKTPSLHSACPLDCGCATDGRSSRICSFSQNFCIAPLERLLPFSVMMLHYCRLVQTRQSNQRPFAETVCDALITNGDVRKPSKKMQNVCHGGYIKHGHTTVACAMRGIRLIHTNCLR